ncbi:MAG: hypothetical protein DME18_08505 [Verrucomicrobia bacterium]|nr:MAG: hypothetical protein DME18_08505 [Verrucomicrobiota bacterium]
MHVCNGINGVGFSRKERHREIGETVRFEEAAVRGIGVGYEGDIGDIIQMFSAPLAGERLKRTRHDFHLKLNGRSGCGFLIQRMSDEGGPARMVTFLCVDRAARVDRIVMDFASTKLCKRIGGVDSRNQFILDCVPIQIGP